MNEPRKKPSVTERAVVRATSVMCRAHPEWGTFGVMADCGDHFEIRGVRGDRVLHKSEANDGWAIVSGGRDTGDPELQWAFLKPGILENPAEVSRLIAAGADLEMRQNSSGQTALFSCMRGRYFESAKALIEAGADVNAMDMQGRTPVFFAGNEEMLNLLVSHGADVKAHDCELFTPLHSVAQNATVAVAEGLISRGADISARATIGDTPLHSAARCNRVDVCDLLVAKGANLNFPGQFGRTALQMALIEGSGKIVTSLLFHGADIHAKSTCGRTALHYAIGQQEEMMRELLAAGAEIDAEDHLGNTPLMNAALCGFGDTCRTLISLGADVGRRNLHGDTAEDIARDKFERVSCNSERRSFEGCLTALRNGNSMGL